MVSCLQSPFEWGPKAVGFLIALASEPSSFQKQTIVAMLLSMLRLALGLHSKGFFIPQR